MKLWDITRELTAAPVYPGDPAPRLQQVQQLALGDMCNLTVLSMCAHNGTHLDAPAHFIKDGRTIDEMPLEYFIGDCWVARHTGDLSAADAENILEQAKAHNCADRILIGGDMTVTAQAARVFAGAGIKLLGNESQSVGPEDAPMQVHRILLEKDIVLLEGIVLTGVAEGRYLLNCAPLNIAGSEGSPCRAVLLK